MREPKKFPNYFYRYMKKDRRHRSGGAISYKNNINDSTQSSKLVFSLKATKAELKTLSSKEDKTGLGLDPLLDKLNTINKYTIYQMIKRNVPSKSLYFYH